METKLKGFKKDEKVILTESGVHSCPKCTSEPYHQGHNEAECPVCEGQFWLDENGLPFNPDKEVRHGEVLRSLQTSHSD